MDFPANHQARRRFLRNGGGVALAALAGGWGGTATVTAAAADPGLANTVLRVGTYKGGDSYYFGEAGVAALPYKSAIAEFAAGNLIVEALAAGSLDCGGMSEIPPIFAAVSGAPMKVIAVLRGDVNNQVVLVPKQSTITDAAQFKGKRIGYARSTTSHYFLLQLLKERGLTFKDIEPVALAPQDGLAAFQSGQLDAWVIYGLVVELAKSQGARVLRSADGYLSGNYVISASTRAIADPLKHAAIGDYLQRVAKVYQWINGHPQEWAAKSGRIAGVPAQLFLNQVKARSQPYQLVAVDDAAVRSQQQVADVFSQAGLLVRRVDVTPLWDRSFASYLA
ncbi:ABC transporter substrate-binding protein [Janthinobacterium agaricidamnosum]|uniref:ABC transporter, substrate-binding protein, aliphatic sulphonate n=1 Tax=Janthinobacterium agaricidamnosum NBRC 102515 = DSM 9628 TaxID=1349767 RepID=W0V0K1_9BURK|nr:ABC transporter substrate-binding protein [Janthinobacterium agaricidamnosum]CDG82359.1 ABC transporter, substrate-binding protein, aliphatic sulphonate [Janthinobacterium agaricidamnosum NBRC 102515 = DSM 9628]